MLTVCPKCALTLVVTAGDLRVGQGYVRCGRCTTVFNALLSLSDESMESPSPAASHPATAALTATGAEAQHDSDLGESQGTGTLETIVLEGDGVLQTEEFVDIATINRKIALATRQRLQAANAESQHEHPPFNDSTPEHWLHDDDADEAAEHAVDADTSAGADADADAEREFNAAAEALSSGADTAGARRPQPWVWSLAAAALLLVAGSQLIHHWRNQLALNAGWYRVLRGPYQQLGWSLNPQWDLASYDLRQLGGGTDTRQHTLHIQLRLANRAAAEIPLPVLRLALYNRFGKRLLTRDLNASDYLPPSLHGSEFMARSQRVDAEFGVADLSTDVASFELDVCLPAEHGMRCSGDQPRT
jgi:predicted Zn finger-like uncharacterized protein